MPSQSRKYMWALAVVVIVMILGAAYYFLRKPQVPPELNECDALFEEKIKDYVLKDIFQQYVGNYTEVWISSQVMDESLCSYFSLKSDGEYMHGYRSLSGVDTNGYGKLAVDNNGFLDVFDSGTPAHLTGKIYPVFFKQFVLGNIFCFWKDQSSTPHWRSVISVREEQSRNKTAYTSIVDEGVQRFANLSQQINFIVNDGQYYATTCYEPPNWYLVEKNKP